MKKYLLLIFTFICFFLQSQNASFFDSKSYQLKYFLKNGVQEDFDFTHHNGQGTRNAPIIKFLLNNETNLLETDISGYCNNTKVKYEKFGNYLMFKSGGGRSLADCGGDEDTDFYHQILTSKVNYEITEDKKGLWLWSDENHKLFFSQKVLSVAENEFEKAIDIFPNPTSEIVNIKVKSNTVKISEIIIFDNQGREILKKLNNFETIDISKLASGIYFLKIKSTTQTSITRKLVKE
ncbi:MAG: T9SS type A sorting domain-containing protein [Polaribacter sp.]